MSSDVVISSLHRVYSCLVFGIVNRLMEFVGATGSIDGDGDLRADSPDRRFLGLSQNSMIVSLRAMLPGVNFIQSCCVHYLLRRLSNVYSAAGLSGLLILPLFPLSSWSPSPI